MVGAGRFLFRYRAWIFPLVFISILFVFRPRPYLPEPFYTLVIVAGFIVGLAGEVVRILTIGLDYIERGGKKGSPFASRLVRGGVYSHVRNPMYVGNLLMAVGVSLYAGDPWIMVTILPFFIFVYYAIVAAEENFLRAEFGAEYEDFCREVNRFCPSLRGFGETWASMTFNWKRPIEKDNGTAFYAFLGLTLLPLWRMHFLGHTDAFHAYQPWAISISVVLFISYVIARTLAKTGRLK